MTQQSHCWAYTPRKPELKETHVPPAFTTALLTITRTWKQPRCPSADEWIRKLWYIYTMEYYSAVKKNEFESVVMRRMKLEPIIEWSKSERETPIQYMNAYIWNLERQSWWSYMQDSKRDIDVKNGLLDYMGEGKGGTIWENSVETCILLYIKQITSASLVHEAGSSKLVFWDNPEGWDGEGGRREFQDGADTCAPMADSCWCIAKPTTILLSN